MCKDEEECIRETLESVYKYIDYWVVYDTGSTDKPVRLSRTSSKKRIFQVNYLLVRGRVLIRAKQNYLIDASVKQNTFCIWMQMIYSVVILNLLKMMQDI